MGVLDRIIDGATDDSVSVDSLLRMATVVAKRARAAPLGEWVSRELSGYYNLDDSAVPAYRGPFDTNVTGHYTGWGGAQMTGVVLGNIGVERSFSEVFFQLRCRESVTEIEHLASGPGEPAVPWPPFAVATWNQWEQRGEVPHFPGYNLFAAQQQMSRQKLLGVLGAVRTTLLNLSLDLQEADPKIGEADGPTVVDPIVGHTFVTTTNHIYGAGASLALAPGVVQNTTISVGDVGGLVNGFRAVGVHDPAALGELMEAATSPERESKLKALLTKIGNGAFELAGNVTAQVALAGLTPLVEQFLGVK